MNVGQSQGTWVNRVLTWIGRRLFSLRYRVEVRGLDAIRQSGRERIVFLPNHPALIDPVLLTIQLYPDFAPRSLADEYQVTRPVIGPLTRQFGARVIPNLERRGVAVVEATRRALEQAIGGIRQGENMLVYPAGRLKQRRAEEVGATSAVKMILDAVPDARVVLVRQTGLWGSSFSLAFTGTRPDMVSAMWRGLGYALLNALFFMPRRRVVIELVEPGDFPRRADRMVINRYLERFYNAVEDPNTYVPYGFWDQAGTRELPDPPMASVEGDAESAPESTRQLVFDHLAQLSGQADIRLEQRLALDLGLDSLAIAELIIWLEHEFGMSIRTPDSLRTVADVVLAASGRGISRGEIELKPVPPAWFAMRRRRETADLPEGTTINELFLAQAAADPTRVIVADQASGVKTYRDLITALMLLKPIVQALPGQHVGVMFPASVGAVVFYLACLLAGKTPVMVNWTSGMRNLVHSLDLLGVGHVITAQALVSRLQAMGFDLSPLQDRFLLAEDLRGRLTLGAKLLALVRSRTSWRTLSDVRPPEHAAVLFTSGSENLPKAVPLTHENMLTNLRDIPQIVRLRQDDIIIGLLPPFHSFGLTTTVALPLCFGLRTVYHPNPTESAHLARIIEAYRVTLLVGTPTFLGGIVRVASPEQLATLRIGVTGAERCPESLYRAMQRCCPRLTVLEGYGITECSPIVSANDERHPVEGSIGRPLASVEAAIVDHETERRRVRPGETGMLLVRGPSIFPGYLNNRGPSPFVVFEHQRWYRTGDLVRQAPDGVLWFEGRLKRFVKLGGEMISLPAIESVLAAAVTTDEDEGPTVAVEALGDGDNSEIALFTTLELDRNGANDILRRAGLSPLHFIRRVIRVDGIPLLGTGKTDYRLLKERAANGQGTTNRVPAG